MHVCCERGQSLSQQLQERRELEDMIEGKGDGAELEQVTLRLSTAERDRGAAIREAAELRAACAASATVR